MRGAEAGDRSGVRRRGGFADVLARAAEGEEQGAPSRRGSLPASAIPPRARGAAGANDALGRDPEVPVVAPVPAPPSPARIEAPGVAELRAYVRAAPPVIAAALRPGGAQLVLSFGSALSLDLRAGAQGLELTLRPAQRLERVARAELPALVEALRAQGIRVARAQVSPRPRSTPRRAR